MRKVLPLTVSKQVSYNSVHVLANSMADQTLSRQLSGLLMRTLGSILLASTCVSSFAQIPIPTSRNDNARTGANTNETLLTPQNVNKNSFGHLFSVSIDPGAQPVSTILAQPLYMPSVNIPGQGTHNVVYVVTLADSVYAIDADNGAQLWYASMLNGGTAASGTNLPCGFGGYKQEGIVSTPAIDPSTNTMYLVAKTVLNGAVRHDLHALDITTGIDRPGSPVQITAQSVSNSNNIWNKPIVTNFNSLHQKNRPGLLLVNGILYMAFGSNGCNDSNTGWVLSYDVASLSQLSAFNTSPAYGLTSIWQSGNGLAADEDGNIFAETAEGSNVNAVPGGNFDIPNGGETYCNSVIKLNPDLTVADYFTPYNVAALNTSDYDLSSTGALVLPDQDGPYPHELIAGGKQGYVYVLNRDNLGMWSPVADQILQKIALEPNTTNDVLFGSSAYWNNTVYFAPNGSPLRAFPLSSGQLGTQVKTKQSYNGSHSPSISSNGNSNGILWVLSGGLNAFNACISPNCQNQFTPLQLLYNTNQAAGGRDKLPTIGHFVTQTVANGKVYVATQTTLEAYGLFSSVNVAAGNGQTGTVGTALATPIQIQASNPYTGQPNVGTSVTFSDGCNIKIPATCGSFNPSSAMTDSNGSASTTYTLPQKAGAYTLTFSGIGFSNATASVTAIAGAPTKLIAYSGAGQHDSFSSIIGVTPTTKPIVAQVQDIYKNPVSGATVYFTATKGGVPIPSSNVTGTNGMGTGITSTTVQLPSTAATVIVTACLSQPCTTGSIKNTYAETAVAPIPTLSIIGGNDQSAPAGTQLPQAIIVAVTDQFGNPMAGQSVSFSDNGAGGNFSHQPLATDSHGTVTQSYSLPPSPGKTITITATITGASSAVSLSEYSQ